MQIPIYSRFRFGPITDQAPNVKKKGEEKLEGGDKGLGSKKGAKGSKREPAPFSGSNMSSDEDEPAPARHRPPWWRVVRAAKRSRCARSPAAMTDEESDEQEAWEDGDERGLVRGGRE